MVLRHRVIFGDSFQGKNVSYEAGNMVNEDSKLFFSLCLCHLGIVH